MFAVVDIETTGGSSKNGRIIEIAIYITDGNTIQNHFSTLINPQMPIPAFISSLTGIHDDMVAEAPLFAAVASRIDTITTDKIFVAHSVNFDFSFVKMEFARLGHDYERKRLCTVRLSRKIFPGYRSYGLGNICDRLDIRIEDRHRAAGDAYATAVLMKKLVAADTEGHIRKALQPSSKESKLPANLPQSHFEALPERPGVYYFKDQKQKVIYVGKAKNLKKRVASHFTASGSHGSKNNFVNRIHALDFVETGNEMIALLLESHEIKKHWPIYNRSQKQLTFNHAVYCYEDHGGYLRLVLSRAKRGIKPVFVCSTDQQGRDELYALVRNYKLCARMCGLQPAKQTCFDYSIGKCDGACAGEIAPEVYNARVERAIASQEAIKQSYVILGTGRKFGEYSAVVVDSGIYRGFGFVDQESSISRLEDWLDHIDFYQETPEVKNIIHSVVSGGGSGYKVLNIEEVEMK